MQDLPPPNPDATTAGSSRRPEAEACLSQGLGLSSHWLYLWEDDPHSLCYVSGSLGARGKPQPAQWRQCGCAVPSIKVCSGSPPGHTCLHCCSATQEAKANRRPDPRQARLMAFPCVLCPLTGVIPQCSELFPSLCRITQTSSGVPRSPYLIDSQNLGSMRSVRFKNNCVLHSFLNA